MSSYAASMASRSASKMAEGMLQPLLSEDDDGSESTASGTSSGDSSPELENYKPTFMQRLKNAVMNIVLLGGIGGSIAAIVLAPAVMVFVASGICIANAPYAIYKERVLTKIPSLRYMNNKLRETANELAENVDELSSEIDILEPEAERAATVEAQLRDIADQQQVNVDKLVELVKENEIVLVQMRDNLRKRIVQDIISIVVRSDKDNDQKIDKQEAKQLALKIRLQLQEYDVDFDSDKFLKVIGKDPSVPGVISIVQKLLPDDDVKEGNERKVVNDGPCCDSDEDSDDEEDEMYDMFYLCSSDTRTRRDSVSGTRSVTSGGSAGVSLMKADRRKSSRASVMLLKKRTRGSFGS